MCEVRVNEIAYVGAGNSTNKKDAEKNAARDFVNFLVRSGKVNPIDVPGEPIDGSNMAPPMKMGSQELPSVFQVNSEKFID